MPHYVVLAQSEVTAHALGAWLELLGEEPLKKEEDPRVIVWQPKAGGGQTERGVLAYEELVRRIETVGAPEGVIGANDVVVLVDTVHPEGLNPLAEGDNWDGIIALLILTFPEIHWIFGLSFVQSEWDPIRECHSLPSLLARARRDPLFDPSGLRDWVRCRANNCLRQLKDDLELPLRNNLSAAIDEERSFAYFHGYTAYRFGCRADVVTSWALMKERFGPSQKHGHGCWLLLEDMSLNFADRERDVHLLHLGPRDERDTEHRENHCKSLRSRDEKVETSEHRLLVTTGQTRPGDTTLADNRTYLRAKAHGRGGIVFKPASGMLGLWGEAGLLRPRGKTQRKGNNPDFVWPPKPPEPGDGGGIGHGSPGRLTLTAERLIRRGQALLEEVKSVEDAVHGAVLAGDALELTGCRTPTTATEALCLKHRFEVLAECQFSGVEYHIRIMPRLEEIELETAAIALWFHRGRYKQAKLNAEMSIMTELAPIFHDYGQYDEEQACTNRARNIHNTLWMQQKPHRVLLWPVLRYLELLFKSFAIFVVVITAWIVGLSLLYWLSGGHPHWGYGLEDAVSSFFSIGGPLHHVGSGVNPDRVPLAYALVTCLAIVLGFLHLGVFVSHLYTLVSRK
jgi:hypothetical protein